MIDAAQIRLGFTEGDVVIVTGAGSGIGRATALNAAAQGLRVAAWDLNDETAHATAAEIERRGGTALAVSADVTDESALNDAFEATAAFGEARFLVNNAGPASSADLDFDRALTVCIGSMRRVTTMWLERRTLAGAALVNVASVAGNVIGTSPDWYPASKAGIMGYTRHLATYRISEVRANAVAPGMTDTPRLAGFTASEVGQRALGRIPLGRLGEPDEIAWAILFLLSPLSSYINGVLLVADGGWTITQ